MEERSSALSFPKLNGTNYPSWKFNIQLLLRERGLYGLINDSEPSLPEAAPAADRLQRTLREHKAHATVCLSLEDDQKCLVVNTTTAKEAWNVLVSVYEPQSIARIASLRLTFQGLVPAPEEEMSVFLSRVRMAVTELRTAGRKIEDDEIAFQMIGRLSPEYDGVVQALYQLKPAEFTSHRVSDALLAESQRLKHTHLSISTTQEALVTKSKGSKGHTTNQQKNTPERRCFLCKQEGHLKRNCPKQKGNQRGRAKEKADSQKASGSSQDKSVLFATASVVRSPVQATMEWILDGAATQNFCNDRTVFSTFTRCKTENVNMAEGTTIIEGFGSVDLVVRSNGIQRNLLLTKVFYAPNMVRNLLSVRIMDIGGWKIVYQNASATVYDKGRRFWLRIPLNKDDLYSFAAVANALPCSATGEINATYVQARDRDSVNRWHDRLGHLHVAAIRKLSKTKGVYGLEKLSGDMDDCVVCAEAKLTRPTFHKSNKVISNGVLDLLHMDVFGPTPVDSLGGAKYFLSITDDYTRMTFLYPMVRKNEVFTHFKTFRAMAERSTGQTVKSIRTDNGMEFCHGSFAQYLGELGIGIQRTNVYSPEMNGVAERLNRTAMEAVRAMLIQSALPKSLWCELLFAFIHVKNRSPHEGVGGAVPYQLWSGRNLNISYLRRIGSLAIVYVDRRKTKLDPRGEKGILVGYALTTQGYRIWFPNTKRIVETKKVKVIEDKNGMVAIPSETTSVSFVPTEVELPREQQPEERPQRDTTPPRERGKRTNWVREAVPRKTGATVGRVDIYYYEVKEGNVKGPRLRSRHDVERYCRKYGLEFDASQFLFSATRKEIKDVNFQGETQQAEHEETQTSDSEGEALMAQRDTPFHAYHTELAIPQTYADTQTSAERPHWDNAMREELETMKAREVFEYVERPSDSKVLGSRWVYTIKQDASGEPKRFRARLVAKGYEQCPGIDFTDTYSPVVNFSLIRLLFVLFVILCGWVNAHLDVKSAYLYGNLSKMTYMEQPPGFVKKGLDGHVWKLRKAIYGLHQSGRAWYYELNDILINMQFKRWPHCNCIYSMSDHTVILVYVDDLVVFCKNEKWMSTVCQRLAKSLDIVNLGPVAKLLGTYMEKQNGSWWLHQEPLIRKLYDLVGDNNDKPIHTPCNVGINYGKLPGGTGIDDKEYRSIIGSLLFLAARSRPDIMFTTIMLSQFASKPTVCHWDQIMRVVNYLFQTKGMGVNLTSTKGPTLVAYSDANWASHSPDRKSFSGFVILLGGVPIAWKTKKTTECSSVHDGGRIHRPK